jgi:hypothetical protein
MALAKGYTLVIQGELLTKEGGERVIDIPQGPVYFKVGPLDYFLYEAIGTSLRSGVTRSVGQMRIGSRL